MIGELFPEVGKAPWPHLEPGTRAQDRAARGPKASGDQAAPDQDVLVPVIVDNLRVDRVEPRQLEVSLGAATDTGPLPNQIEFTRYLSVPRGGILNEN